MTPDDWITFATLLTPILLFPCLRSQLHSLELKVISRRG